MEGALTPAEAGVTRHHARVVWEGTRSDLRAHRVELAAQVVPSSCSAHWGGDPGRADPEEMFAASLAACHMLWFLSLARARRIRVGAYEDEAEAVLEGDSRIRTVVLRPRVEFEGEPPPPEVLEGLHHEAHARCFLAASVNCPVEVEPR